MNKIEEIRREIYICITNLEIELDELRETFGRLEDLIEEEGLAGEEEGR